MSDIGIDIKIARVLKELHFIVCFYCLFCSFGVFFIVVFEARSHCNLGWPGMLCRPG